MSLGPERVSHGGEHSSYIYKSEGEVVIAVHDQWFDLIVSM